MVHPRKYSVIFSRMHVVTFVYVYNMQQDTKLVCKRTFNRSNTPEYCICPNIVLARILYLPENCICPKIVTMFRTFSLFELKKILSTNATIKADNFYHISTWPEQIVPEFHTLHGIMSLELVLLSTNK